MGDDAKDSAKKQFRERGLQVIVKISGIELTPEKGQYGGGAWHLEGMMNEHIVATAIYYYDCQNVTESHLHFRQGAYLSDSLSYEQDDHEPLSEIFGTENMRDEPAIQELGSIATLQGRLLVFPNTLQHRVGSFSLQDPTKSGHRRFLLLWLVEPNYRITSTANVPPQQQDWWATDAREAAEESVLPNEIVDEIIKEATDTSKMTLEQAKSLRLELMDERTNFDSTVRLAVNYYNLCEH